MHHDLNRPSKKPLIQLIQFIRPTNYLRLFSAILVVVAVSTGVSARTATEWKSNDEARTRLLVPLGLESDSKTVWAGLEMELEEHWHSYWKNPGDAGFPPVFSNFDTSLIQSIEVEFTPPKFYPAGGGLAAIGYADHVIYPLKLTLTERGAALDKLPLQTDVSYLVCKNICIPHDESFSITVDLGAADSQAETESHRAKKLISAINSIAKAPGAVEGLFLSETLSRAGEDYLLRIDFTAPGEITRNPAIFFHPTPELFIGDAEMIPGDTKNTLTINVPIETKVADKIIDTITLGYLLTPVNAGGEEIAVETVTHLRATGESGPFAAGSSTDGGAFAGQPFWLILLFALAGGLILNIMPCVLPVLSIKLMGILQHSGQGRGKIARGMLASSGGIIVSFLLLATAAVVAQSAGEFVGWGIQFQNPLFVTFLVFIVTLFAFNMWGLFEITLPTSVSTGASKTASGGGHFVQGMFATLLATPCSAPFLGTAITFALSSPPAEIFAIFGAVGVGMSLPYILIAVFPALIKLFPKPGAWMEKAKVVFGFLLLGTALWLISATLSKQLDSGTLLYIEFILAAVALVLWIKKSNAPHAQFFKSSRGLLTTALTAALAIFAMYLANSAEPPATNGAIANSADGIQWAPYSEAEVDARLSNGDVVFVDVTAEWCVTCKANEKLFIDTDEIRSRISDNGIVPLKADWTNRNDEIGAFLKRYGRSGIPFYIIFYGGSRDNYLTLPITITGGMLAEKLDEAVKQNSEFSRLEREPNDVPAGFKLD